jgi:hypothetical protein
MATLTRRAEDIVWAGPYALLAAAGGEGALTAVREIEDQMRSLSTHVLSTAPDRSRIVKR